MALLRYAAKFDSFLSLDCARVEGVGAQSKERKGSNFEAQRSGAIVLQAPRAKHIRSRNLAIVIWQPCCRLSGKDSGRTSGRKWAMLDLAKKDQTPSSYEYSSP